MLSMKGLVSLKIDTDYNSCLLFESTKMGPEDLKKLGAKYLFLLFPTVEAISTSNFPLVTHYFFSFSLAISQCQWLLVSSVIEVQIVFKLNYFCGILHGQLIMHVLVVLYVCRSSQDVEGGNGS